MKKLVRGHIPVAFALIVSILGRSTCYADPITFEFTGTVTEVTLFGSDPFAGTVSPGTTVTGSYTFDATARSDIDPSPEVAYYDFGGSAFPFVSRIGTHRIESPLGFIRVIDNAADDTGFTDAYQAFGFGAMDGQLFSVGLTLLDHATPAPIVISNTLLPVVPPNIRAFSSRSFSFFLTDRIFVTGALDSLRLAIVPFRVFSASVEMKRGPLDADDALEIAAIFALGADSNGIDPLAEDLRRQVGSLFQAVIPSCSFELKAAKEKRPTEFRVQSVSGPIALEAKITPLGTDFFAFKAEIKGLNLAEAVGSISVALTIGNDGGSTTGSADVGRRAAK